MLNKEFELDYLPEVKEALAQGRPVVALESNVITHGLNYPDNLATALQVEAAVRASGCVPSTTGIDNGRVLVGMNYQQLERFATTAGIAKVSSRDLPFILATGAMGATSVASSLVIAELAGIPFFSSAGLGGVHRGAETSMDISADLIQLTRSKVTVICAGVKNILDVGLTLEYLETQCVPVVSWQCDDFPAFYCRSSGFKSPMRIDCSEQIARAIEINRHLPGAAGLVIATPTREEDAINSEEVQQAIEEATSQAKNNGITGNGVTKFIMKAVEKMTAGRSAEANKAVLINTARIAGEIAMAHYLYRQKHQ
ncbi:pseudouridine-5'-phosphate glycosidase [Erwinia tracheiphila]|uniref:Pseudouridine-5'-phosphate glycosidase n=1 Tax=Erwinia tracheiphila TaxID=65700 RepID=A0A0M2KFN0_9GAMM|nr:pseudouridine-5'-phosphate glycosidase [Erwinia tracheiphila]KKF37754.1 pseudouridine-5'-phosphate glycosidase [Erwinia tracheiphila]UIA86711.1 pseudouridine-5'-phosphate glycosidase [Erwinia tracheiphila]UIA95067.1 pseudouridine-5'-phosphate glycosidase [Erwinia tracheiphila]